MKQPVLSEKLITKAVIGHWRALGLPGTLVAAIPSMGAMGQYGLTRGLPDLMVLGGGFLGDRVGFIELKTTKGRASPFQRDFADRCELLGIPYALTRGREQPIAVLEEWQVVRAVA